MDNKKKYLLGVRVNAGLEKEAVQELKDIWGSGCQVVEGEERKEKGEGGGEKAGEEGCGFVLFWTSELEKVNLIRGSMRVFHVLKKEKNDFGATNYEEYFQQLGLISSPLWEEASSIHQLFHKKKGEQTEEERTTFRVTAFRNGHHKFNSMDAQKNVGSTIGASFPSWKVNLSKYGIDFYVHIWEQNVIFGVTLRDDIQNRGVFALPHRSPTALQPTLASLLVRKLGVEQGMNILDPCCGIGTIIFEAASLFSSFPSPSSSPTTPTSSFYGSDIYAPSISIAQEFLSTITPSYSPPPSSSSSSSSPSSPSLSFQVADAGELSYLPSESIDRVVSDLPFGQRHMNRRAVSRMIPHLMKELTRVVKEKGRVLLLCMSRRQIEGIIKAYNQWRMVEWAPIEVGAMRCVPLLLLERTSTPFQLQPQQQNSGQGKEGEKKRKREREIETKDGEGGKEE